MLAIWRSGFAVGRGWRGLRRCEAGGAREGARLEVRRVYFLDAEVHEYAAPPQKEASKVSKVVGVAVGMLRLGIGSLKLGMRIPNAKTHRSAMGSG